MPGEAKLVFEPAALTFRAAFGEFLLEFVHFFLSFAIHEERNRFGEFEERATVENHEFLAMEFEGGGQDFSGGAGSSCRKAVDIANLAIFENGDVEIHGFFCVVVEPEKWRDFLHENTAYAGIWLGFRPSRRQFQRGENGKARSRIGMR